LPVVDEAGGADKLVVLWHPIIMDIKELAAAKGLLLPWIGPSLKMPLVWLDGY
jgi:hypothetical protein